MSSRVTMELVLVMKKGESNTAEDKHNLSLSLGQGNVTKTNYTPNLNSPLVNKEYIYNGYNKKLLPSSGINLHSLIVVSMVIAVFLSWSGDANASPFLMSNCLLNPDLAIDPKEAASCKYGNEVDACGTFFCSKGPRDYCGGKFERYGVCGDGLMCNKCNRCTGCSTKTFECWYDDNCIWSSD